ncbi:type II secretion system protein [Burkholderia multivorans]|uniref:type II secretion system protein n=1 Tax=Burkholderia multivorans TaxID=87883 RepID=UPI0020189AEC|nr:type II secretion system protein [Burkholderia multivorans]MCO1368733.1 type II secretion system protein [Burkholderia multivorans]MCO1380624.1 type II secretion system protein [Burkholderia multivorans]MDN8032514.1 type II secretion system protein [Burkholderia multivorans]UQP21950.1 type II secretion system protein [Burkholderia multivorans]UQP91602.1 type II secretion system protein [Burkholderia multivorans]
MIKSIVYTLFRVLPPKERLRVSTWRFKAMREMFYRETRLDVAKKGLRNSETLLERLDTLAERHRKRKTMSWLAFQKIAQRMRAGDDFATAMKPFIPNDEFVLLELASESPRDDAAIRGLELAQMAAHAKGVLSATTSMQMAYPAFLIVYLYAFCVLFGSEILPATLDVQPLEKWSAFGRFVYAFDTFCADYWWLTSSVVAGLILGYFQTLKRWTGKFRNKVDAMPLMWRNRRDLRAALLIVSLAGLFDSGLTLRAALDRLMKMSDPWMRWHLRRMSTRLTANPDKPMQALDTGIFSETTIDIMTDAAGRDQFVESIKELGQHSLSRVVDAVKRNAKITHYVLLGGAVLLFLVFGLGSYFATGAVAFDGASTSLNQKF